MIRPAHALCAMVPVALAACAGGGKDDGGDTDRTVVTDTVTDDTTTLTTDTAALESPPLTCPTDAPPAGTVAVDPGCVATPTTASLDVVVEWEWRDNPAYPVATDIMMTPITANLTDDDGDGDIDDDDVPDLVFSAFVDRYEFPRYGPMVALSGADGTQLWAFQDVEGVAVAPLGGVAAGDLDGDGLIELVSVNYDDQVYAFHPPTPTTPAELLWVTQLPPIDTKVYPALGDLDGDGAAEVFVGPHALSADGTLLWSGATGPTVEKMLSFPVDVDGDGRLELVAGNAVYDDDGSLLHSDAAIPGYTVVVQADADPAPEYVRTANTLFEVLDDDWTVLVSLPTAETGGGPPVVADFDGDGVAEVGVSFVTRFRTYELDGSLLWEAPMLDSSSVSLSASAFDFDGDGAFEVVFADESTLWVYDGATGTPELAWDAHGSGTSREYPIVVDLDRDGSAEIVLASNDYFVPGTTGVTVLGAAGAAWPAAPRHWNEYSYHTDNVNPDGTLPATMAPGWTTHGTFRAALNDAPLGPNRPDWRVGEPAACLDECDDDSVVLFVPVENTGLVDGGPVRLRVTTALGESELGVGVVPSGSRVWAGPLTLGSGDWDAGGVVLTVLPASPQCDTTDDARVLDTFPCDQD